jgi:hypothetical protein
MKPLYYDNSGILYSELNTGNTQKIGAVSKVIKNVFLTLHGHSIRCQQQPHAYCGAGFQDGVAAGESFLCAPF